MIADKLARLDPPNVPPTKFHGSNGKPPIGAKLWLAKPPLVGGDRIKFIELVPPDPDDPVMLDERDNLIRAIARLAALRVGAVECFDDADLARCRDVIRALGA